MIIPPYNKTDFAVMYYDKMRIPYKDRADALSKFHRLKKINAKVLEEILEEGYEAQTKAFKDEALKNNVKFYKA